MLNFFTFDGKPSFDFSIYLSGSGTYAAPERDVDVVEVPGRNGEILFDNGRYRNIEHTYKCGIVRDFSKNLEAARSFLLSREGYKRLEDTYHPDEFYIARISGGVNPEILKSLKAGEFDLTFDRKPQRFLKLGENVIEFAESGMLYNPTLFAAAPLIRVIGTGNISINGTIISISGNQNYTDIDCETENAYMGSLNLNSKVIVTDYNFPKLTEGINEIEIDGPDKVEITPRWYTL